MHVSHRELRLSRDHGTLLDGQLPALTARSVSTVVRTTAAHEEISTGGNVDVRFVGTLGCVLKGLWTKGGVGVDALW